MVFKVLKLLFAFYLILQALIDLSIPVHWYPLGPPDMPVYYFDALSILLGAGILFHHFGKNLKFKKYVWTVYWMVVSFLCFIVAVHPYIIMLMIGIFLPVSLLLLYRTGKYLNFDRIQWMILWSPVALIFLFVAYRNIVFYWFK